MVAGGFINCIYRRQTSLCSGTDEWDGVSGLSRHWLTQCSRCTTPHAYQSLDNISSYAAMGMNRTMVVCKPTVKKLCVIRIQLKKIIRITRKEMHWVWSMWPGNLFGFREFEFRVRKARLNVPLSHYFFLLAPYHNRIRGSINKVFYGNDVLSVSGSYVLIGLQKFGTIWKTKLGNQFFCDSQEIIYIRDYIRLFC